ncbi:MAG: XRE family transcriptional regulator [Cyanobacteria bacterium J06635_13]
MALKFYESPFHATKSPKIASKSVLKADMTIMIRDTIEQQGWTQKEAAERYKELQSELAKMEKKR